MINYSVQDKKALENELLNLYRNLGNNPIDDLYSTCKNLGHFFEDINLISNECDKIKNLSRKAYVLQQDTVELLNNLKNFLKDNDVTQK